MQLIRDNSHSTNENNAPFTADGFAQRQEHRKRCAHIKRLGAQMHAEQERIAAENAECQRLNRVSHMCRQYLARRPAQRTG